MPSWGGHRNGRIPLAELEFVGRGALNGESQYLHPAAADAWRKFVAEIHRLAGVVMVITEGYRPLALQQHYYNTLPYPQAAWPGTSTHGWALAVDMANYQRVRKELLRDVGQLCGFSFATGDRVQEPWHVEFVGSLIEQAGGGTVTPITPEIEDDMFSDADRALLLNLAKGKDTRELVQTPDGTVWFVVNRILRYGIPRESNLNTYKAYLRDLGYSDALIQKSASDISAYGAPVYDGGVLLTALGNDRVAAAVAAALPPGSQPVSTAGLAAEFAKLVPTAAENGAAARAAIVK